MKKSSKKISQHKKMAGMKNLGFAEPVVMKMKKKKKMPVKKMGKIK